MKTAIIGAGTWGTALSRAIALKTEEVTVWTCIPEEADRLTRERAHWNLPGMTVPGNVSFTTDGEEAVRGAEFIIVAVPSVYVRQTMNTFREQIKGNPVIICASKGIESSTLLTLTGVIRDELHCAENEGPRIAAISGPTHAEEVARDMPTLLVAASENLETAAKDSGVSPYAIYKDTDLYDEVIRRYDVNGGRLPKAFTGYVLSLMRERLL